ncbi:MAG: hydroxymethylglutaryl-CoA reductase [Deltaproteobacteria bacterium]|jgi:hydroxymethylglutaryl-CoA reductase (NADPH)|nr:hydroxymethylglutaryl-CoA reductase [Deltaproteobacteria bacterium]
MPTDKDKLNRLISRLSGPLTAQKIAEELAPKTGHSSPGLRHESPLSRESVSRNWGILKRHAGLDDADQELLADAATLAGIEAYSKNIENFVGTVKIPVGVAGPLRINGFFAKGDVYVPLATTEAALVASYHRGARLITAAGGCTALIHDYAVSRSPGFIFADLTEAGQFMLWATQHYERFQEAAAATTRHGQLMDMRLTLEGNHVYMNLDFHTGEAAGQNMATFATDAVVRWITENSPVAPAHAFVEANFSGDKKASSLSFVSVRGKKVTVEVFLSRVLVGKFLHTTPRDMARYWQMAALGAVMSGTMGVQGHFANGLAALYLATGQDAACISESSVGVTRMEVTEDDGLYASVTMPNIIVGTVGGGSKLPSQSAGLKMLQLSGEGQAHSLAEICASLCLAGELSIIGALTAGHFADAHKRLAR